MQQKIPLKDLHRKQKELSESVILRADVDNLGTTFVYGFQRPDGSHKYVTLSRTATLSRQLSLFFKCYINSLLREDEAGFLLEKENETLPLYIPEVMMYFLWGHGMK